LKENEKRWEVIDVDSEDDSPQDNKSCKKQSGKASVALLVVRLLQVQLILILVLSDQIIVMQTVGLHAGQTMGDGAWRAVRCPAISGLLSGPHLPTGTVASQPEGLHAGSNNNAVAASGNNSSSVRRKIVVGGCGMTEVNGTYVEESV